MIYVISIVALTMAAIALGLSIASQSWESQHKREHDSHMIIRQSIDRCTQSQLKHIQNWLESTDKQVSELLKRQEEEA